MNKRQEFGGPWTQEKLACLAKYLGAYTTIFRRNPRARFFNTYYVDAFAGTGSLANQTISEGALFKGLERQEAREYLKGSARLALEVEPGFDNYLFIERDEQRSRELEKLRDMYPAKSARIEIRNAEANAYLGEWCSKTDWQKTRAVAFLDPYGMQVKWRTLELIAGTKAIDLWVLFPLGSAVNRLLTTKEPPPESWAIRLTEFLGTDAWKSEFYPRGENKTLFGPQREEKRDADFDKIGSFFLARLQQLFAGIASRPLVLRNSTNVPIFLLCFAAGNPKGAPTAVRIAQQIIGG